MPVREPLLLEADGKPSWTSSVLSKLKRAGIIMRVAGLLAGPLQTPALPPPPPPIVEVDRRPRGGQRPPDKEGESGPHHRAVVALGRNRAVDPLRRIASGTPGGVTQCHVMDRLGRLAATTRSEAEAEAYIGALPTLAAQLVPAAAPSLLAAATRLGRGLSDATKLLRADPATRGMTVALPVAARNTALRVGDEASRGRPVTPDDCARTLAEEAVRALRRVAARG